ncbi:hypothetical protein [Pseudoduganella buxea]|uniref:Metalloprotease n=1 Tax=Pseudoduganella buxea TaxID=1949069 RepID=A0A6I3T3Z1_9BURK|nr:hypothetical protein [Pseudoduganella buxea]MTV55665.1 hypothetical protein [Pseudoduganella buxea]GGB93701.1 hypothetical protein GCM10011572_14580 [Pseudoduganella buxea]
MLRRLLLAGLASLSLGTAAQWPQSGPGGAVHRFSGFATGGCAVSAEQLQTMYLSDLRYKTPPFGTDDPDHPIADSFSNAATDASLVFDVDAVYGLYDDVKPNALAVPFNLGDPRDAKTDGTVLLGRRLILEEQRRNPRFWGTSVTLFMAHEYAHIRQFKKQLRLPLRQGEVHADFMAGWYLGAWNRATGGTFANMEVAARALFNKGDYAFNSATSHGTPEQRVGALRAGYGAGAQGAGLDVAFQRGIVYVREEIPE